VVDSFMFSQFLSLVTKSDTRILHGLIMAYITMKILLSITVTRVTDTLRKSCVQNCHIYINIWEGAIGKSYHVNVKVARNTKDML